MAEIARSYSNLYSANLVSRLYLILKIVVYLSHLTITEVSRPPLYANTTLFTFSFSVGTAFGTAAYKKNIELNRKQIWTFSIDVTIYILSLKFSVQNKKPLRSSHYNSIVHATKMKNGTGVRFIKKYQSEVSLPSCIFFQKTSLTLLRPDFNKEITIYLNIVKIKI